MTGIDQPPRTERFGAATPGARPSPTSLESLLTTPPQDSGKRRFTPRRIMAGIGMLVIAGAGYAAGRYTAPPPAPGPELVVTSTAIPAGARLTRADLRVITVERGVSTPRGALSPAAAARLVGLVSQNALPTGTFVERSLFAPGGAIPGPAQALIGLALKPGQLPSAGLSVGQHVLVVELPVNPQGVALNPVPIASTTVWYVLGPDTSGNTLASVVVPARLATRLAGYAARGQIALVSIATGSPDSRLFRTGPNPASTSAKTTPTKPSPPAPTSHPPRSTPKPPRPTPKPTKS
jgi:hypothetical protein